MIQGDTKSVRRYFIFHWRIAHTLRMPRPDAAAAICMNQSKSAQNYAENWIIDSIKAHLKTRAHLHTQNTHTRTHLSKHSRSK